MEATTKFNQEHEMATQRLNELMEEYLAIKKLDREVKKLTNQSFYFS
jgi:hypothetical protein